MELKTLISTIRKELFLIIIFVLAGFAASLIFNSNLKTYYQAAVPIYIKSATNYPLNWHDQTDTVIGILRHNREIDLAGGSAIDIKKITSSLILISSKNEKANLASTDLEEFLEKGNQLIGNLTTGQEQLSLQKINSNPEQLLDKPQPLLNLIVGSMVGGVFGLILVLLKLYFKK